MDRYHRQLMGKDAYPDPTETVSYRETHISRVYLTDSLVYKLKKPLNLGFLDFSTLEKRKFYCHEEVRLNRRFSPETYLGVSELVEKNGRVGFSGNGRVIDYAVRMKRLPDAMMLDQMLERAGHELPGRMSELAEALDKIFKIAEPSIDPAHPNNQVVENNCRENLAQTEMAIDRELSETAHRCMARLTENQLDDLREVLRQREADGFVRDGHGDLHSGNICMTQPIQVYDCIEFNRRFRVADIASDLAFLLMDLEFRRRPDLSAMLLKAYQERAQDTDLDKLLPFYKQYRAWVRGKVDAILASENDVSEQARHEAHRLAIRYFNLALGYSLQPTLFVTTGLMGVGKSTFAEAIAGATNAVVLRSDIIRKELADLPTQTSSRDNYGQGLYSSEMTENTYDELYARAERLLIQGKSVVADASFADPGQRRRFKDLAKRHHIGFCILHLRCADEVALARLDSRTDDASDGRRSLYWQQKQDYDLPGVSIEVLQVDSSVDVDYNVQAVLCHLLIRQEPDL